VNAFDEATGATQTFSIGESSKEELTPIPNQMHHSKRLMLALQAENVLLLRWSNL
jgi:hypothetical protein